MQHGAPAAERITAQILAIAEETVECRIYRFALILLLQQLKSGDALSVEYHDLAIEKKGCEWKRANCRSDPRKALCALLPIPRKQLHAVRFFVRQDPVAVIFLLIEPSTLM